MGHRILELDGIRGIAIAMVLLYHFRDYSPIHIGIFSYGWLGVDVFFVLSGYLITGILLASKEKPDYFRTFYKRRILRIFPLYYSSVAAFFLLELPFWHSRGSMMWLPNSEQLWYWTYLANFRIAAGHVYGPISHFWSLAVEEQFYFVWPMLVYLLSRKQLRIAILAFGLTSLAFHQEYFRFHGLALGALLANEGLRMPAFKPLRFALLTDLGTYSYGLYVLHPIAMRYIFPFTEKSWWSLLFFPASYALARLSWSGLESRFLALKDTPMPRPTWLPNFHFADTHILRAHRFGKTDRS